MLLMPDSHVQQPQEAFGIGGALAHKLVFSVEYAAWDGYEAVRGIRPELVAGTKARTIIPGMVGGSGFVAGKFSQTAPRVESYGNIELFPSGLATWQIVDLPDDLGQTATSLVNKWTGLDGGGRSYTISYNVSAARFGVDIAELTGLRGARYYWNTSGVFSTTVPNNIIVTINPNAGALDKMHLWVNGKKVTLATQAADIAQVGFYNGTANLEIGRINAATAYYDGKIVLARAWDRLLTPVEIQQLSRGYGVWMATKPPSDYYYMQDVHIGSRQAWRSLLGVGR